MIHMPHRSVTRFFVPLIDVLLLLFCIFLLMPFANEDDMEKTQEEAIKERDNATTLRSELDRREDELQNQLVTREQLRKEGEYDRIKAENDLLRKKLAETPDQKFLFHMIDIDREDGELYSINSRGVRTHIKDAQDAKKLIQHDRQEADKSPLTKEKKLYYCFIYPRPQEGRPTEKQVRKYKEWFADVEVSFLKGAPP
jgi:hypothetical protein